MDYRDNRQRWAESHQVVHFYAGQWCTFTPALTRPTSCGPRDYERGCGHADGKVAMRSRTTKLVFLMTSVLLIAVGSAITVLFNLHVAGVDNAKNDEERILHIARYIARTYDKRPPGSEYYGIFYSRRLPRAIRLPTGVFETLTHASDCDSMVRALIFLAAREGIEAHQSDIFAPTFVHSIAEVRIDGRWVLVDPYLGVVFRQPDGKLANFKTIKSNYAELKQDGLRAKDKVAASAKFYYSRLTSSIIAQSGTEVLMPLTIETSSLPMTIGKLDASNGDVVAALVDGAMGPIGSFLGPRLGSRKHTLLMLLVKPDNANVEITFQLTDPTDLPPPVVSAPAGACISRIGALRCRAPAGVSELVIRHGDWRRVFAVDQIRVQKTL